MSWRTRRGTYQINGVVILSEMNDVGGIVHSCTCIRQCYIKREYVEACKLTEYIFSTKVRLVVVSYPHLVRTRRLLCRWR
jgi:hypothetical protein